jgi:hypothetical protein
MIKNDAHSNRSIRLQVVRDSIPSVLVRTSVSGGDVFGDDVPFRVDVIYRMD